MAWVGNLVAVLLLVFCSSSSLAKLPGGNFKDIQITLQANQYTNRSCRTLALYKGSHISQPHGKINVTGPKGSPDVQLFLAIYEVKCGNFESDNYCEDEFRLTQDNRLAINALKQHLPEDPNPHDSFNFHPNATKYLEAPTTSTPPTTASTTTASTTTASTTTATPTNASTTTPPEGKDSRRANRAATDTNNQAPKQPKDKDIPLYNVSKDGIYNVQVIANLSSKPDTNITVVITYDLEMKTPFGYLSAVDYPALVFYSVMIALYAIYGITWIVLMACSFKDLVRLQFWIGAVIILGFLEKAFFVSEYSSVNFGNDSSGLNIVAEGVSAAKRALARMLLIIVSLGFGTVKPRLGDSLGKVVAAGVIYFVFALIDGIVRTRSNTSSASDTSSIVTLALLLFLDIIIFYWIFSSLVATRRALRLRKNYVKLSLYNHFTYTLIFAILATIGFLIWVFLDLNYPRDNCLTDWKEVWLRDCFWHILFAFILGIVMILWRPSSNRIRFAYSLVNDHDEDQDEPEQENKNFETVKMRTVTKPGSETPVVTSTQAEDDLRWVEENLPTTAVDKALPFVLDSDEEVMTTRFEMSKMN